MKYLIVSNGSIIDYDWAKKIIKEHDFVVCADGGAKHMLRMDITPDIIVGDLDSIDNETKTYFLNKEVKFIKVPKEKDFTDTELAIEYAIDRGAENITLMGVLGSRMDHSLVNLSILLPLSRRGVNAKIVDENNEIIATEKPVSLSGNIGELLSIIPISECVEGVTLTGMEYPLDNATISLGSSIGVSNKLISDKAKIEFKSGALLVIKAQDQ